MRAPVTMQEVPSAEWRSFLERFGRAHRAWLGTMHWVSGHGNVTTAERVALEPIGLDAHLSRKIVRLCFLEGPSIRAERPQAARIERNERGAERALEIDGGRRSVPSGVSGDRAARRGRWADAGRGLAGTFIRDSRIGLRPCDGGTQARPISPPRRFAGNPIAPAQNDD